MDIKCRKLKCTHNDKYVCKAPHVDITKGTECASFEEDKTKGNVDPSKTLFEKTPSVQNYRHVKDLELDCCAACLFNKQKKCCANGILVLDGKDEPVCGTFIDK